MPEESRKARRYERRFPGTGCPESQKEERMERLDVQEGRRSRSVLIPELPWERNKGVEST